MSNYFNMGKLAVEKGPKIVRKVKQAIQTTKSPIKQAVETIKATFAKPKKPKIGGTRKSDQIKKSNRMIKDLDKTMEKDMSPELRAKGEKLKKEIKKTQKEVYRTGFKLGKKVEKKKKIAIKASFIQCSTDNFNPKLFIPINKYLFKVVKYKSANTELLINNAIIAANNNTNPLAASNLKNHLKGLDI